MAWEPRLGKSLAEVCAIIRRQREAGVTRTLVVGPKNPLLLTWEDELGAAAFTRPGRRRHAGYHIQLADMQNIDRAAAIVELKRFEGEPVVVTLNFDCLDDYFEPIESIVPGQVYEFRGIWYVGDHSLEQARNARAASTSKKIVDLLLKWNPQALIVDEAHLIAAAGANRSQALRRLGRGAQYVRLLSGTPDPKRAPSFYSQYVVLDPNIFGTNKQRFIDRYFYTNPFHPAMIERMKPEHEAEFYGKVFSVMSRVRAEDYFGPNKPNEYTRELNWPEAARTIYDKLQKDNVLTEDDLTVDGTHLLTKILRALQLCAGFLRDEMTEAIRWLHKTKEEAILADLAEPLACGQSVVISYSFTEAGVNLRNAIATVYGNKTVALANGQTKNVTELLRTFGVNARTDTPLRVLVLQEQVGGVGVSLARARHLMFHSWSMDSAQHDQMRHRIWHPSLVSNIGYYQMKSSADGFARKIVRDKLDASIMARKLGLYGALNYGS